MEKQRFITYINSFLGFNRHNGVRLADVGEGTALVEAALTRESLNPQGTAHGGLIFTLADCAAGCACMSRGRMAVTQNSSISYVKAGRGSLLRARAAEEHYGRKSALYSVRVTDGEGELVATGTFTYFLLDKTLDA